MPQYGNDFVGRDYEIQELKSKIRTNGVVVITGDRGIGKTNLMKISEEFLKREKECHYIENGLLFSKEIGRFFLPEKIITGASASINVLGIGGGGAGESWKPREPSILEYMEKTKEKVIFVENAHELKKEEIEIIFSATYRNEQLRFVLEIATPYMPDIKLKITSDQIVELKKLRDEDIDKIIVKECPNFSGTIVQKIIFLSKGYPYIARSLAYICDKKNTPDEMLEFLDTLRDDNIKYILDRIHKEVLETLGKDAQEIIKKLALASSVLTSKLIEAFCGEEADATLNDIIERGILIIEKEFFWMYHPLFRDYLRSPKIQPIAVGKRRELYRKAMEQVKSEFDSIYMLLDVMNEPDIFKELIEITENYDAILFIGRKSYTWGKFDQAFLVFSHILKKAKEKESKEWESIAVGNLGILHQTKGEFDKALENHEKALKLYEEIGNKNGVAAVLGNMGNVYSSKGEIDKALEYYEKSRRLHEEIGDKNGVATNLGNIGIVYYIKEEHDRAFDYFEKALKLHEEIENQIGTAEQLVNIGIYYGLKKELSKALDYFKKALNLDVKLGNKVGIALNYVNIGAVYKNKGDLEVALRGYNMALRIFKEMGIRIEEARTLVNIGDIFVLKNEKERAIDCYIEALGLAIDSPFFERINRKVNELLGIN